MPGLVPAPPTAVSSAGRPCEAKFRAFGPGGKCISRLETLSPSFVHAHFGLDGCAAMPLAKRLGLPLVVTFHGYDVTVNEKTMLQWRTGRQFLTRRSELAKTGALFIAVSQFIKQRLLALDFPEERIVVHYIGVDTKKFSVAEMARPPRPSCWPRSESRARWSWARRDALCDRRR